MEANFNQDEQNKKSEQWPGVTVAYDFVFPSYQWALARLDAVDTRIQILMAFVATITFTMTGIAITLRQQLEYYSLSFVLMWASFATFVVLGLYARSTGSIILLDIGKLYQEWLHLSEWQFKKDMVWFAGQHYEANMQTINLKSNVFLSMIGVFMLEATAFLFWIG